MSTPEQIAVLRDEVLSIEREIAATAVAIAECRNEKVFAALQAKQREINERLRVVRDKSNLGPQARKKKAA